MLWRTNPNCPNLLLEGSRVITALSDLYSRQVLAAASGRRAPWSQMCLVDWRDKLPIRSAEQCDKHHYTKATRCVKRMSRGEDGYGVYMSALQDCISFSLEKSGLPGQNASRDNRQRKHLVDYIASQDRVPGAPKQTKVGTLLAPCYQSSTHGKSVLPRGSTALPCIKSCRGQATRPIAGAKSHCDKKIAQVAVLLDGRFFVRAWPLPQFFSRLPVLRLVAVGVRGCAALQTRQVSLDSFASIICRWNIKKIYT